MKQITTIILAILVTLTFSCTKDSDDTDPVENYTIKYEIVSTGDVIMDTIKYLDVNGTTQYLIGEGNLSHSFTQPSNNYHALLYASGSVVSVGSCTYSIQVIDENGGNVNFANRDTDFPVSFKWLEEYSHTEN